MKYDFFLENSKSQKNDFSWALIERLTDTVPGFQDGKGPYIN